MPSSTDYEIVRLCSDHYFGDFDCGEAVRNAWLRSHALSNQDSDDAQTYVAVSDGVVVGFYALAVGSIVRHMLPTAAMRRNAPDPVGYVLLGQLGVDLRQQRQGLGRQLVLHGMRQATRVAELAGCRLSLTMPGSASSA